MNRPAAFNAVIVMGLGMFVLVGPMICMGGEIVTMETRVLVDFTEQKEVGQWRIINDGVMGGLSQSGIEIEVPGSAVFEGHLSLENNGGFASVRRLPVDYELLGFDGVLIRLRGDGRTYQFRVRSDQRFDGVSYQAGFKTEAGKWVTVRIPFASLSPTFRGRPVPSAPKLRPQDIRQIGFLIGDKHEGKFRIEIDSIQAYLRLGKKKTSAVGASR